MAGKGRLTTGDHNRQELYQARDEDAPAEIAPLMGQMFALAGGDPFPQLVGVGRIRVGT
jgi:hypothetical protein